MNVSLTITDQEFVKFQHFAYHAAGISLSPAKKALVASRLMKRLRHYGFSSYGEYFQFMASGQEPGEMQTALDLLTTNETYFFREPQHFEFLRHSVLTTVRRGTPFRVWSAASSSGEEPYTLAMILADTLGEGPWDILASDISARILEKARSGHYPMERAEKIPRPYLLRYCLKGVGLHAGTFLIDRSLRHRVQFRAINLNESLPSIGTFDVIFLRNVMIYFEQNTKRQVVDRLVATLKPGGYLFISHSETLNGITTDLRMVQSSIYQKAGS